MTLMAAMSSVKSYFPGSFHKAEESNVMVAKAGHSQSSLSLIAQKIPRCPVRASAGNPQSVDIINGKKVNGVHVAETPDVRKMNMDDNIVDGQPLHTCLLGRFLEERLIYRQTFVIRSYEIGPDKTATMETLMNFLQVRWLRCMHGLLQPLMFNNF